LDRVGFGLVHVDVHGIQGNKPSTSRVISVNTDIPRPEPRRLEMNVLSMRRLPIIATTALFFVTTLIIQIKHTPHALASAMGLDVRPENRTILVPGPGYGNIQIRVTAPDIAPDTDRPLLNLALVIDKSGSMNNEGKMEFARQAAHQLVDRMGKDDILSIVTYDQSVRVVWPARRVTDNQRLHRIIDGIYPGGRTFLSGGLEQGYRQAKLGRRKGYLNRVLLLSDGLANVGVVDRDDLRRRAGVMAERNISVSTFGVGYEFDEDLLAKVARGGGGSYYYISNPSDMAAALKREFQMASSTVATDVEIIIRLHGNCRFDSATGHSWRIERNSVVIGLGDLSAGESRTLMARLNVPVKEMGDLKVADVSVRYRDPKSGNQLTRDPDPVSLEIVEDPRIYKESFDDRIMENKAVLELSADMDDAARMVDKGDREGAISILKKAGGALMSAPSTPNTKAEIQRNEAYQDQIQKMDRMEESEVREMQKDIKYRSYQNLYQQ
jgi:Ca-activated chloride channel family protein